MRPALSTVFLLLAACGSDPTVLILTYPENTRDTEGPYRVEVVPTPNDPERIEDLTVEFGLTSPGGIQSQSSVPFIRDPTSGTWWAQLPGRPAGTVVEFRVKLVETSGKIVWAPVLDDEPLTFQILTATP